MSIAVERKIEKSILSYKFKANESTHPHYRDIGIQICDYSNSFWYKHKKFTLRCPKIEMISGQFIMDYCLYKGQRLLTASLHLHFLHFCPNRHTDVFKEKEMRHLVTCLTQVDVGVESQRAVLYVEGEGVDIEVTGADNFGRLSIMHPTVAIQVHVRDMRGCVFIHTARQEQAEEL